jgi:hypothetical protein
MGQGQQIRAWISSPPREGAACRLYALTSEIVLHPPRIKSSVHTWSRLPQTPLPEEPFCFFCPEGPLPRPCRMCVWPLGCPLHPNPAPCHNIPYQQHRSFGIFVNQPTGNLVPLRHFVLALFRNSTVIVQR